MNPLLRYNFDELRLLGINERSVTLAVSSEDQVVVEFESREQLREAISEWFALSSPAAERREHSGTKNETPALAPADTLAIAAN